MDALEQTWQVSAEIGEGLTEHQWSAPTRCSGWGVAATYAQHSAFPLALATPLPGGSVGEPLTAVEVLRRLNAPGGVAYAMAEAVADSAAEDTAGVLRRELVERFGVQGPAAVVGLRLADLVDVVPWPASGGVVSLAEIRN